MKNNFKLFAVLVGLITTFTACDKADVLQNYGKGNKLALNSSTLTVAALPTQALDTVLSFSWVDPKLATATDNEKFVIEFDTSASFSNPVRSEATLGKFSKEFTGQQLNEMLLKWGFAFNTAHNVSVRLVSSYANNNDLSYSDPLVVSMAPYKIPPKIPVPAALFLVGDVNGWNNSAGLDKKFYFYKTGETTFTGVFNFSSGGAYKLIQELGNWDTQFRMIPGGTGLTGEFKQENSDPAFPNPSAAGSYRITVDFQNGKYSAVKTEAVRVDAPAELYIVGDVNGWNNSGSLDAKYKFTKVDDFVYTINVTFAGSGGFKLIQQLGNWDTQFRKLSGDESAGEFDQKNADPTFPAPGAGTYKVTVNFATNTYTIVKQ
jgi:hypothetical protein